MAIFDKNYKSSFGLAAILWLNMTLIKGHCRIYPRIDIDINYVTQVTSSMDSELQQLVQIQITPAKIEPGIHKSYKWPFLQTYVI